MVRTNKETGHHELTLAGFNWLGLNSGETYSPSWENANHKSVWVRRIGQKTGIACIRDESLQDFAARWRYQVEQLT